LSELKNVVVSKPTKTEGVHRFTRVEFRNFKAFKSFTIKFRRFNILVGPNNAGKSTVLAAFRILSAALRKAHSRKAELVDGPEGKVYGYSIDLKEISVAEENIFHNYKDEFPAKVEFFLSNQNRLVLYFPERNLCFLIATTTGKAITTPGEFKRQFNCSIGFVPILGPVDHDEKLYEKEAAYRALYNYSAAKNFRNIWHHYPEKFDQFQELLSQTWPGMEIEKPKIQYEPGAYKHRLTMFCPEERIPREIFWAGFGFQVWCQLLTHIVQSEAKSIFLIDEPDIYLHSDLQRQLVGILRNLGPDILIATHSTEIITEAEPDDILVIDKNKIQAKRIRNPAQLSDIFATLGSNLNPFLTQLAKTKHAIFVEGKDFQVIAKFATKLGVTEVSTRRNFVVIPIEGFNPVKVKNLVEGIETTLGSKIMVGIILDRDFRSIEEIKSISAECLKFSDFVHVHDRKEIENYLLVPDAIDRAVKRRIADIEHRTEKKVNEFASCALVQLEAFAIAKKNAVSAQLIDQTKQFERSRSSKDHDTTITARVLSEIEARWSTCEGRLKLIPGKEALSEVNKYLQAEFKMNITPTAILDSMQLHEIQDEMKTLIATLNTFAKNNQSK
jgi:predicted ATP-dependent endonuclease of OLD family